MSIYTYPIKPPVAGDGDLDEAPTQAVDYVCFRRKRILYDHNNKERYYGLNVPGNNPTFRMNNDIVYLAMPPQLSTSYTPQWSQANMGIAGIFGSQMMNQLDGENSLSPETIAAALQDAAASALPQFTQGTLMATINSAANAFGLGGSAGLNDAKQMANGSIFNPYMEQTFKNMGFRTHAFNFKLFAKNQEESKMIKKIIDYFKEGSLPEYESMQEAFDTWNSSGTYNVSKSDREEEYGDRETGAVTRVNDLTASSRFFKIPDYFEIKFLRHHPNGPLTEWEAGNNMGGIPLHFKIKTSVCNGIGVNYAPDGTYNSMKHLSADRMDVPAIQLQMRFTETQLVTKRDISAGY